MRKPVSKMNPRVFFGASLLIALFLLIGVLFPERADAIFGRLQGAIVHGFGWFYILAVAGFLIAVVFLAASRYGRLKLGPDDSEPDYSYPTWMAMLFAAGMGIGLMFFAVAEPIQHFAQPPDVEPDTLDAARQAMVITFFHWGVHAWAIYGVVGLSLAYFCFRYNLPLTVRSGLYPLLGERTKGRLGDAVDIFAICGTLFGIATSLGFGVLQINAGLNYLLGVPQEAWVQVILIAVVTAMATASVMSGLDVGIRRLSELNLLMAIALMLFVLAVGPTGFLLNAFAQNLGNYLDNFFSRTFNIYAYQPSEWMSSWTLFYWAWWIAWSPFVGMFIARISRGRTVREFLTGVLLVPAAFTFLWMTVFGNTAISLDMGQAAGQISAAVGEDVSTALFKFLEHLPWPGVTSTLAVMLVAIFFVTSSDSGSLVVDTIAAGGEVDTPAWQRLYWCSLEGVAAALLLLAGGLSALQTATLVSALPFSFIMILLVFGLVRGMRADMARAAHRPPMAHPSTELHWRRRLANIVHTPRRADVRRFLADTVAPALRDVAQELDRRGIRADIEEGEAGMALAIASAETRNFVYGVQPVRHLTAAFSAAQAGASEERRPQTWLARTYFSDGSRGYDIMGFTRDQIIADVLTQYERYRLLVASAESRLYIRSPDPDLPE